VDAAVKSKRVVLVDDHPAVLRQVARLLPAEFEIVGILEDGAQLEAALATARPDLIVLDITLPGVSGIELARRLTATGCPARIVFLTVHADPDYAREAVAVGGLGYVVKARLGTDLVPALRAALAGRRFISPCPEVEALLPGEQRQPVINANPTGPSLAPRPQRNP
jgi:DNA-binding NarL/FixJ family response regulator